MKVLLVAALVFASSFASAAGPQGYSSTNAYLGFFNKLKCAAGLTCAISNNVMTVTPTALFATGQLSLGTARTFVDSDATPDVSLGSYYNTNTTTFTITDFDGTGIVAGQLLVVVSKGAITYDVTSTGIKCGSTDIITASGDVTTFIYDGTDWFCVARYDLSDDLN